MLHFFFSVMWSQPYTWWFQDNIYVKWNVLIIPWLDLLSLDLLALNECGNLVNNSLKKMLRGWSNTSQVGWKFVGTDENWKYRLENFELFAKFLNMTAAKIKFNNFWNFSKIIFISISNYLEQANFKKNLFRNSYRFMKSYWIYC